MKVGYQGEPGAFSQAAAYSYFGEAVQNQGFESFEAAFEAVETGDCEMGLIPIENSVEGSIHRNYDLLLEHQLHITGEYFLHVRQCLIAHPGIKVEEIKHVISHPQALGQCRKYLRKNLNATIDAVYDTAGSVKMIAEQGDRSVASIAADHAAGIFGMQLLAVGIEDNPNNYTRFLAISKTAEEPKENCKTSIVFSLRNEPGALHKALGFFASRAIDLTKLESRPLVGKPWHYQFYIDLAGNQEDEVLREALDELITYSATCRVLGSYERHVFEY